jgi:hypothetical protein
MISNKGDATLTMKTLSERLAETAQQGYTENFRVAGDRLISVSAGDYYTSQEVCIVDYFRFEGYTDPQDSSILYLIQTDDGRKGTLIDAYGVYADSMISDFVSEIESCELKPRLSTR